MELGDFNDQGLGQGICQLGDRVPVMVRRVVCLAVISEERYCRVEIRGDVVLIVRKAIYLIGASL